MEGHCLEAKGKFDNWHAVLLSKSPHERKKGLELWLDKYPNLNAFFPDSGHGLLSSAAYFESTDLIRCLIELGANPDIVDDAGWSALHWSCQAQRAASVLTLLECGADPNHLDPLGRETATPLHFCAMNKASGCARILLAHGADPCRVDPTTLATPMHWGAYDIKFMKEAGMFSGFLEADAIGRGALHWCIRQSATDDGALLACRQWLEAGSLMLLHRDFAGELACDVALRRQFSKTHGFLTSLAEAEQINSTIRHIQCEAVACTSASTRL